MNAHAAAVCLSVFVACAWGQLEAVEWLVLVGKVAVNEQDGNGSTALHLAVDASHADVVRFLLAQGASMTITNVLGVTPADLAQDGALKGVLERARSSQPQSQRQAQSQLQQAVHRTIYSDEPPPPYSFS